MKKNIIRIFILVSSILLVGISSAFAADNTVWKEYVYSNDGFAITSPSEPVIKKNVQNTKAGPIELRMYSVQTDNWAVTFSVSYLNFDFDPQKALIGGRDGAIKAVNGKLISDHPISIGVYPGIEFDAEGQGFHSRQRLYIVGKRNLYQSHIAALPGTDFPAEAMRIFESFRLLPR